MTDQELHSLLVETFGPTVILGLQVETRDPSISVAADAIADVCHFLVNDARTVFDALNNLCAVDWLETDPKKKTPVEPHLEVLYHLFSYTHKHACVLKVRLPRWRNDEPGQLPRLPTVSDLWAIATWHEREAYDLMGIEFVDHPDLRRILCPEDWVGHPLRKDYEFPLEYHGIRAK